MTRILTVAAALIALIAVRAIAAASPESWWDRAAEGRIGHYWIKTDLAEVEARELSAHLNLMYDEFNRRLGSLPQRRPEQLNVLIFRSRDDYLATLGARYNVNARGTGGIFFARREGTALALWTEGLPRRRVLHVLQHEAFHQFAFSRFGPDLPVWVNEGLAEYFGAAVIVNDNVVSGQSAARTVEDVRAAVENGDHFPFRRFLSMTQQDWAASLEAGSDDAGSARAAVQYSQAWSMVQFLIHAENGRYVNDFERYLRMLADGSSSEEAFRRAFGTDDIDVFEQRWREYALAAQPSAFVTALERIEFLAEGMLELRRRGERPESMQALRDALREIDFGYLLNHHGIPVALRVADEKLFTIPDEGAGAAPAFRLVTPRPRRMTRRERMLEEADPTPPAIATVNLTPREIEVRWIRRETPDPRPGAGGGTGTRPQSNGWRYEIVVR